MPIPFSDEVETATAALPWSVRATHTNFNQTITSSTALTTSGGTVGYYNEVDLLNDHNISLPSPGTIRHFVSPEQPIFTFSAPTRVIMIIPTTTPTTPIREAGWIYSPMEWHKVTSYFIAWDTTATGVITNLSNDNCYERNFEAGTYNLDPSGVAPEAFYLFEELIDGNVLNEVREWQVQLFEKGLLANSSGDYSTEGDITTTGNLSAADITGSGIIEIGKDTDGVSHINMARIESASFGTGSMVTFSHHDRQLGSNLALAQTDSGETLINSETNTKLTFRIGGLEKMRVNPNGDVGIGTNNPLQKLHVDGEVLVTNGTINVAKNEDETAHFGRGRIGHFDITNPQTGVTTSSVSFSHHDCDTGTNFSLLQTEDGETLLNSETGKHTEFRLGGVEKMRVHSNGFVGINQTSPAEALDVGGSIKATGHLHKLISTQEQNSVVITKDNHDLLGIAGSKGAGLIIHGDATSLNAYGGSLAITGSQVNKGGLGPFFEFLGSRSTYDQLASGTHTAVTDGDVLGYFRWMGDDGNDCRSRAADISCEIDGTVAENTVPGAIRFSTRNSSNYGERMRLSATGNVGIGTTSPDYKLDVNGSMKSLGVIYGSTSPAITKEWKMFCHGNGNLHFDFQNGNGNFVTKGYLNQNVVVGAIDFTGQHRSKFEGDFTSKLVGLIVESTGAYLELDGSVQPKIDEALPSVKLTTAAKSKRVYGVLSNIEGGTREYGSGFVTVVPKDDNITRVVVNSVGEGSLWVINTREQALENGDYICSSNVAGYGEKQDDDILHSYTVAKITMSLDWSNLPDWLETRNVTASGEVSETGEYKAAFVGVTYHCG